MCVYPLAKARIVCILRQGHPCQHRASDLLAQDRRRHTADMDHQCPALMAAWAQPAGGKRPGLDQAGRAVGERRICSPTRNTGLHYAHRVNGRGADGGRGEEAESQW